MDDAFEDSNFDKYEHPLPNLMYTPISVPGPGANLSDMDSQLAGCCCSIGTVCLESQACQKVHLCSQNYSTNKLLLENKWSSGGIVECNSQCSCSATCINRVVQFGPKESLEVFQTNSSMGYGLRTQQFISKGAFICEYAGEVISMSEAKMRFKEIFLSNGMNYIFVLREIVKSSSPAPVIETIVDPSMIGNVGRYINHSCSPNSGIIPVRIDSFTPKLCIFAKNNIASGEEITYDYSGGQVICQSDETDCVQLKICHCKSVTCKGFLPMDSSLL